MNSSIYFDCQGDDVVLRKLFIAGGLDVFIAGTQHVVQPKGARADIFEMPLPPPFSYVDFSKGRQTEREGRKGGRGENLFSLYIYSQAVRENGSIFKALTHDKK